MSELLFEMLENEYWWGGVVNCGYKMPLGGKSQCVIDVCSQEAKDQSAPVFLSSKGRFLWSKGAFSLHADKGRVRCEGMEPVFLEQGHGTLRGAYLAASAQCFPFAGGLPDSRFFDRPQYNTWIELGTNQTAEAIVAYARGILAHNLPAGILMIDEGWQEEYGVFAFNRGKIPNPKELIAELHKMGFAVMLWVTPFAAAAGPRFMELQKAGYLVRTAEGDTAIRKWWNGYSAVLDLTNEKAYAWLNGQLQGLMKEYAVDGFKFDAGDAFFYRDNDQTHRPISAREQTKIYNQLGEEYALNEFRAAWNYGGRSIVTRLQDKLHSWDVDGLGSLISHTAVQGLLGYAYCCPDMVGGGDIESFETGEPMDEELFVRWAQASACMGMIQMSIAPWRVLSEQNAGLVAAALKLHADLGEEINSLARHAAKTGEPLVRHMAYVCPQEGLEAVNDQFFLGNDLLVCPVLKKGATERRVQLPKGNWKTWKGEILEGGQSVVLSVKMEDIPLLRRL